MRHIGMMLGLCGVLAGCQAAPAVDGTARRIAALTAVEQKKLVASDATMGDHDGQAVALSADGLTALVGAESADLPGASDAGAAYVYTLSGGVWGGEMKLSASDRAAGDGFGQHVALSDDGNTALIGAYLSDAAGTNSGAAYVYTRSGSAWDSGTKITAADGADGDHFGVSVSLSGDGSTALIGAEAANAGVSGSGAAYVYTQSGGSWSAVAKLSASDKKKDDFFGQRVALSEDGLTALIGAYLSNPGGSSDAGAAYVYVYSGGTWGSEDKLTASDGATGDHFGVSVALSRDGNTALVGAHAADLGAASDAGAAYVYLRSGGTWAEMQKLIASDNAADSLYGNSVALSADGQTACVGAVLVDSAAGSDSGAAYVYTRSGSSWGMEEKVTASDDGAADRFGTSVALSRDGVTVLVGAALADIGTASDAGAAYVYRRLLDNGTACSLDADCASGFCIDGVCCDTRCGDSVADDCQACTAALKASGTGSGTCGAAKTSTLCRPSQGACDLDDFCDGSSMNCPTDQKQMNTYKCGSAVAGKLCDADDYCDGVTNSCPKKVKPMGTVCRNAIGPCDVAESCNGSSDDCPFDAVKPAMTVCKSAGVNAICDPADFCDGSRKLCPSAFGPLGMSCDAMGHTCKLNGICN